MFQFLFNVSAILRGYQCYEDTTIFYIIVDTLCQNIT